MVRSKSQMNQRRTVPGRTHRVVYLQSTEPTAEILADRAWRQINDIHVCVCVCHTVTYSQKRFMTSRVTRTDLLYNDPHAINNRVSLKLRSAQRPSSRIRQTHFIASIHAITLHQFRARHPVTPSSVDATSGGKRYSSYKNDLVMFSTIILSSLYAESTPRFGIASNSISDVNRLAHGTLEERWIVQRHEMPEIMMRFEFKSSIEHFDYIRSNLCYNQHAVYIQHT